MDVKMARDTNVQAVLEIFIVAKVYTPKP